MQFEEWEDKYKPIKNHLAGRDDPAKFEMDADDLEEDKFETYGIELGFVLGIAHESPAKVWTLVEGDGGLYIVSGYHLVNRLNYFITEVPSEDDDLEVSYWVYQEEN